MTDIPPPDGRLNPDNFQQRGRDPGMGISRPEEFNRAASDYLNDLPILAYEAEMQAARNLELASSMMPSLSNTAPEMLAENAVAGMSAPDMLQMNQALEGTLRVEDEKALLEAIFGGINDWEERLRLWQNIDPTRQQELIEAGFEVPADPKPGGISIPFTSPIKKIFNWALPGSPAGGDGNFEIPTGDNMPSNAVNAVLNAGDDTVRAGVSGLISGADWLSNTLIERPYRAGAIGYQGSSLDGGPVSNAAMTTAGGPSGLGPMLASGVQSVMGLGLGLFRGEAGELWAMSGNRDGSFNRPSIARSLDILDQNVELHQMAMAYVEHGNNFGAIIPAVEELTGLTAGMPGFSEVYLQYEMLLNPEAPDEKFAQATDELMRGRVGLGITSATLAGFEPGSTMHNVYSAVSELGILIVADPLMVVGKANQVRKLATYAVRSGQSFNELSRARELGRIADAVDSGTDIARVINGTTTTNSVDEAVRYANAVVDSRIRRTVGDRFFTDVDRQLEYGRSVNRVVDRIVRAVDPEDAYDLADATREVKGIGYMRTQLIRAADNPDFNYLRTRDDVYDWLLSGSGQRALTSGATGRDPRMMALPRITSRNEQWYRTKSWFRRKMDLTERMPQDMLDDVERNVREFWDNGLTVDEASVGVRRARDLDNRTLLQRGRDNWFGAKTLGHRFTHHVPRSNRLSAVTGGTEQLDNAANQAILDFERFTEFGDLVDMPNNVKAQYVDQFTRGNEAERWIAIRSFVSEMMVRSGMADSSDKVQEIMRRYGFAMDQEFGVVADGLDDIGNLTARNVINHNAIWDAQTSVNVAIPDFKRVRRSLHQNAAIRMWGTLFDDVIDAQMTRWWRPTVLFRLGFIPRAAGEETTSFILRLGGLSYLRAQWGRRWALGASRHPATGVWTPHSELSPTMRLFYAAGWQLKKWSHNTPRHTLDAARTKLDDFERWRVKNLESVMSVTPNVETHQQIRAQIWDIMRPHVDEVRAERGRASRTIEAVANSAMSASMKASPRLYSALRAGRIPSRQDLARGILGVEFKGLGRNALPVTDDIAHPFGRHMQVGADEWWSQVDGDNLVLAEFFAQHVPAVSRIRNEGMGSSWDPYQIIGGMRETTGTLTGRMPLTPVTGRFGRNRYIRANYEHLGFEMVDVTNADFRGAVGQAMIYPAASPVFRDSGALTVLASHMGNRTRAAIRSMMKGKFKSNDQIRDYVEGTRRTIARFMEEGEHTQSINDFRAAIITGDQIPESVFTDMENLTWIRELLNSSDTATRNRVRGLFFPDRDILNYPVSVNFDDMVADVNARLWSFMSRPDYQESLKTLATAQANNGTPITYPLGPNSTRLYTVMIDADNIEELRTISSTMEAHEVMTGEILNRLWTEPRQITQPVLQPRWPSQEAILSQLEDVGLTVDDWSEARRMLDDIRVNLKAQAEEADDSIRAWLDNMGGSQITWPPPDYADGGYDWVELLDEGELDDFINAGFLTDVDVRGNRLGNTPDTAAMWYNRALGTDHQVGEVMDQIVNQWRRSIDLSYFIRNGRIRPGSDLQRLIADQDLAEMGIDINRLLDTKYWDEAAVRLAEYTREFEGDIGLINNVFTGEEAQRHILAKTTDALESSGLELDDINEIVMSIMENNGMQPGSWLDALIKQRDAMPEGEVLGRVPAMSMQFSDPYVAQKVSEALEAAMNRLSQVQGQALRPRGRVSLGYYDHWTDDLYTDRFRNIGQRAGDDVGGTAIFIPEELDRMAFEPAVPIDMDSMVEFKKTRDGLWFTDDELAARADHGRHDRLTGEVQWATGQTEHATRRSLATQRLEYAIELFTGEDQESLTEVMALLKNNVFDTEYHTLSVPQQDLVTEAARPLTVEMTPNWFERLTNTFFGDVVDPVMEASIRSPLFNHNFASAMPQAQQNYHMAVQGQLNDQILDLFQRAGIGDDTVDNLIGQIHLTFGVEGDGDDIQGAMETLSTMLANPQRYDAADVAESLLRLESGEDTTRLAMQDVLDEISQIRQESILHDVDMAQYILMEGDVVSAAGVEINTAQQVRHQMGMLDDIMDSVATQGVNFGDYSLEDLRRIKESLDVRLNDIHVRDLERAQQLDADRVYMDELDTLWDETIAAEREPNLSAERVMELAMEIDDPRNRLLFMLHSPIDEMGNTMLEMMQRWSASRYHHFQDAMQDAAIRATNMSVEFIDDHRFKSQFQQTVGNLMPFHFAQEQFIKRQLRMLMDSPESIRRASLLMNAGRQAGLIQTDVEGNEIFVYPGTQYINSGLMRFSGLLTGMDGLHVMAQPMTGQTQFMLPGYGGATSGSYFDDSLGFGPFVGFSTAFLADRFPELEAIDRMVNRNEVAQGRKPWEHFVPPSVQRMFDITGIEAISSARMAGAQQRAVQMAMANGLAPEPDASPLELQQFERRVRNWARIINIVDTALYFGGPFPTGNRVRFGDLEAEDAFTRIMFQSGLPWPEGMALYLEQYPDATPWTVFGSNNVAGAPVAANAEQYQWIDDNRDLITNNPHAASYLMIPISEQGTDEYNARARRELFEMGLREEFTTGEFIEEIYYSQAANAFYPELEQYDLTLYELRVNGADQQLIDAVQGERDLFVDQFEAMNPIFAQNRGINSEGYARRQQIERERRAILAMPRDELPQGQHQDDMLELMQVHQEFVDAMDSLTGQDGREVEELRDNLRIQFLSWAQNYSDTHPSTQPYFGSVIRWDDRILDGGMEVVMTVQAMTGKEL